MSSNRNKLIVGQAVRQMKYYNISYWGHFQRNFYFVQQFGLFMLFLTKEVRVKAEMSQ